jgi:site-specific DNA-methyltransferase (adenine-specific)
MNWQVIQGDCLEVMKSIPDGSIDACITDPPYGTTACSWDVVIPFALMWAALKRIVKPKGAIVLFGSQPFTSRLVMSNPAMFKYEIVWEKTHAKGFFNADYQPLRAHENILVFAGTASTYSPKGSMTFNPQMEAGDPYKRIFPPNTSVGSNHKFHASIKTNKVNEGTRCPRSVVKVSNPNHGSLHGAQKPVNLLRYLVRAYSNEGDTILDFTCGSGTTGVACAMERRGFIGIEHDADQCVISSERIRGAKSPLFESVA